MKNATLNADGFVRLMTEAETLYSDVKKAEIDEEINALANAKAAGQAIDASDKILNREGVDPVQEQKNKRIKAQNRK